MNETTRPDSGSEIQVTRPANPVPEVREQSESPEDYLHNLREQGKQEMGEIVYRGLRFGYVLREFKEGRRYQDLRYDTWNTFTAAEFNFSGRHANRLVKMADLHSIGKLSTEDVLLIGPTKSEVIYDEKDEPYFDEVKSAARENSRSDLKATVSELKQETSGAKEQRTCHNCDKAYKEKDNIEGEGGKKFVVGSKGIQICYLQQVIVSTLNKNQACERAEACSDYLGWE